MTLTGHAITQWSAVSPYGIGAGAFADGVAAGPAPVTVPPALDTGGPTAGEYRAGAVYLVPGFEIRTVLGRTGTRSMDRASALAITAVRELLGAAAYLPPSESGQVALALGTTAGSKQPMVELTRDMLVNEKPFYVDPSRIPNAVMNTVAAQSAIWHHIRGPNATVAGGRTAGLLALKYTIRLLDAGRARYVLCGGVEEFSAARAWLEHYGRPEGQPGPALGEGAGVLVVGAEGPGAPALARVLAAEFGVHRGGDAAPVLAGCVRRALSRAGLAAGDVWATATTPVDDVSGAAEVAAVAEVFAGCGTPNVPAGAYWGDAGAASVPFQIAALLCAAGRDARADGRAAVVTSVDRDGVLGCAVLAVAGRTDR